MITTSTPCPTAGSWLAHLDGLDQLTGGLGNVLGRLHKVMASHLVASALRGALAAVAQRGRVLGDGGGGGQDLLVAAGRVQQCVTGVLDGLLRLCSLRAIHQARLRGDAGRVRYSDQIRSLYSTGKAIMTYITSICSVIFTTNHSQRESITDFVGQYSVE